MRLTLALGSLLAIAFCGPVYAPAASPDDSAIASEGSSYDAPFSVLEMVEKAKPNVKGKPLPPKPDALPTYELVAAVHGFSGALPVDLVADSAAAHIPVATSARSRYTEHLMNAGHANWYRWYRFTWTSSRWRGAFL